MTRIQVIVEGATEESFVRKLLYDALLPYGVFVQAIVLGVPGHKGGRVNYARVKSDILRTLKQDRNVYCTTLLDFYGIGGGFPALLEKPQLASADRVREIEQAMLEDICEEIPDFRPEVRFVPYIQIHEFEGLLFSNPSALADGMARPDLASKLKVIRESVLTPEDINDGNQTAPSKRILGLNPGYNKVISGVLAAEKMGLDVIRQQCPRFRQWFDRLAGFGNVDPD